MQQPRTEQMAVFDPEGLSDWPQPVRWSILTGCKNPITAARRAAALAERITLDDSDEADRVRATVAAVLRCCLHAAARADCTVAQVRDWIENRTNRTPVAILELVFPAWARELSLLLAAAGTDDEAFEAAARLFEPLTVPSRSAAVDAPPAESFDLDRFMRSGPNTVYLVSRGTTDAMAAFTAVFAAEAHEAARQSSHTGAARPDPTVWLTVGPDNPAPLHLAAA
ncbi:hypothetical protein [Nocardia aurantia]|uniref:Uncharacterized protein n=1 Tax=Nocardia aurantia TaxID=2585199 RepID=A0A7K0DJX3_9NOCA|nr:hypothetical protein [Nocardia aurantia]MQY26009.1 hypothetical protein [Nocardia aurantia]